MRPHGLKDICHLFMLPSPDFLMRFALGVSFAVVFASTLSRRHKLIVQSKELCDYPLQIRPNGFIMTGQSVIYNSLF